MNTTSSQFKKGQLAYTVPNHDYGGCINVKPLIEFEKHPQLSPVFDQLILIPEKTPVMFIKFLNRRKIYAVILHNGKIVVCLATDLKEIKNAANNRS